MATLNKNIKNFNRLKGMNKSYNFYGWAMVIIFWFRANSKVDCCIVLSHCAFPFFTTQTLHAFLWWYYFSFVFIETLIFLPNYRILHFCFFVFAQTFELCFNRNCPLLDILQCRMIRNFLYSHFKIPFKVY